MILAGIMAVSVTGCGGSAAKDGEWAKNVKIQVPAKAGGGTDVMARALANKVSAESGSESPWPAPEKSHFPYRKYCGWWNLSAHGPPVSSSA